MDYLSLALIIVILSIVLGLLWREGNRNFDCFEKQGIPYVKPTMFVGNIWPVISGKMAMMNFVIDMFNRFPEAKVVGLFGRQDPSYMIRDPELMKQIGIKDFEYFIGGFCFA